MMLGSQKYDRNVSGQVEKINDYLHSHMAGSSYGIQKCWNVGRFFYIREYKSSYLRMRQCTCCLWVGKTGKLYSQLYYGNAAPVRFLTMILVQWPVSYLIFRAVCPEVNGLVWLSAGYLAILHLASVAVSHAVSEFDAFKKIIDNLPRADDKTK